MDLKNRGRLQFLAVVFIFGLPFILGPLAYKFQWFDAGVNNHGQLIAPPLNIANFVVTDPAKPREKVAFNDGWYLLLNISQCDDQCQPLANMLLNTRQALGREKDRVDVMIWQKSISGLEAELVEEFQELQLGLPTVSEQHAKENLPYAIYIVDPHGNIILSYPIQGDIQHMIAQGRDILKDLKKLLKVSRIG